MFEQSAELLYLFSYSNWSHNFQLTNHCGELAQMVERPLSMREVPGSIPGFSSNTSPVFFSYDNNHVCFH